METTSAREARFFQLVKLHAKGGGDNGKITEHAAAHQRNTAKKRDVGKPFFAAGEFAAEPGQQQACGNGDRRTVNFTAKDVGRDPSRDPADNANHHKSGDQGIAGEVTGKNLCKLFHSLCSPPVSLLNVSSCFCCRFCSVV